MLTCLVIIYDLLSQKPFWDRAEQRQFFLELNLSIKLDKTCVIADVVDLLTLNQNWLSWIKFWELMKDSSLL